MVLRMMSLHGKRILRVMAERSPGVIDAGEVLMAARVPPGIGYPIVHRWCAAGLLVRHWEDIDPATEGRPRGCYYTLTRLGVEQAEAAS